MNVGKGIASCLVFLVSGEDNSEEWSRHVLSNLAESTSFFNVSVDSLNRVPCNE